MPTPNDATPDQALLLDIIRIIRTAPQTQPPTPMGDATVMLNAAARNRILQLVNAALPPELQR